ncbi:MAG: hydantoinase/oxoprolinase family protein [Haloarculaceae archaeon]
MVTAAVGVDVGGTFTDVVLVADGRLETAKVPSTGDQSVGVLEGIRKACAAAGIRPEAVSEFSHAMTVSTNALLEGTGARTALVTTAGFRDVLEIGRQARPDLYDPTVEKPTPLVPRERRFEVTERTTTDGIRTEPEPDDVDRVVEAVAEADAESVAVSLLHAYADPSNERRVAAELRESLDCPVSASHEVMNEFREYERTSTTAVDAYVTPAIDRYLRRLEERAAEAGLPRPTVMQSNGGIADAESVRTHAVQTVLSGPAAGAVGASRTATGVATERDLDGIVTFDMGGTSSDVSLVRDDRVERTTDSEIGGHPVRVPMVDVETVGSGGGSIAWVDAGGALRVGPRSAGADPGPASYGRGGERPTVTDANVVLGYIGGNTSLGGELDLDEAAAERVLAELAEEAGLSGPLEAAEGVFRVVNTTMTRAIRSVTVERGHDPREFGMVAFGGAGPMHAAALADRLDVGTVVVPLPCGVLSAYGLLDADETYDAVRTHRARLDAVDAASLDPVYGSLLDGLPVDATADAVDCRRYADLRYRGQSYELQVAVDDPVRVEDLRARFHAAHDRAYGYTSDEPIEVVNIRVTATVPRSAPDTRYEGGTVDPVDERAARFDGTERPTPVYERTAVPPGATVEGPAILEQDESTTVIPPDWHGTVEADGTLVLRGAGR